MDNRICENIPYGNHITIKCIHHPEKKWFTKNILYIGARSIFYANTWNEFPDMGQECECPSTDLIHDHKDD